MKIETVYRTILGSMLLLLGFGASQPARGEVVLCNTLGSQAEVENSAIGLDGTFNGGGFTPGMSAAFGDAYTVDGSVANPLVTFPKEVLPVDAGTIEFWAKLTNPPTSIPPPFPAGGDNPAFVYLRDATTNSTFRVVLNANDGLGKGGLCSSAGTNGRTACTTGFMPYTYEQVLGVGQAEDWHHYALVWDRNGVAGVLGGTRKLVVFLDGVVDSGAFYEAAGADFVPLQDGSLGVIRSSQLSAATQIAVDELVVSDVAKIDFSDRFDPVCIVDVDIDIRPFSRKNVVNPMSKGKITVLLFGSEDLDVRDVDPDSLGFGPNGAPVAIGPFFKDRDHDGFEDLVALYRIPETGIAFGDTEACLTGETFAGTQIEGCDTIHTVPGCGLGLELALILPGMIWLYRRRRLH